MLIELTKKISKSLEKSALIMEVDGELKDLSHQIIKNSKVDTITIIQIIYFSHLFLDWNVMLK